MPLSVYDLDSGITEIAKACAAIGRDPATVDIGMFYAMGYDAEQAKKDEDKGAKRGVLPLPSDGPEVILPMLDDYAKLLN